MENPKPQTPSIAHHHCHQSASFDREAAAEPWSERSIVSLLQLGEKKLKKRAELCSCSRQSLFMSAVMIAMHGIFGVSA